MPYSVDTYGIVLLIEGSVFTLASIVLLYQSQLHADDSSSSKLKAGIFFLVFGVLSIVTSLIFCVYKRRRKQQTPYLEQLLA